MKKLNKLLGLSTLVLLSACSTATHMGTTDVRLATTDVEVRPMEASLIVGEAISGEAYCSNAFWGWLTLSSPTKQAYGATLQEDGGEFAGNNCSRAAVYNALKASGADVIVAPQYETVGETKFFGFYNNAKIKVKGYKGTYKNIKEMSDDVVKHRQMHHKDKEIAKPLASGGMGGILSFLPF
ncbi:MAG: hypothetical protein MJ250_01625 [Alphaproteobacteria bacterium]|nr:hypothetical protein [Alphaproteobacteria bacterium]